MVTEDHCMACPIYSLKDNEAIRLSPAEIISVSPSAHCQKVYSCLDNLLTTQPGKPSYTDYPQANVTLYQNGKNQPFASCLIIWQACNIMTARSYHNWQYQNGYIYYEYQGRSGKLIYRLPRTTSNLGDIDIRSVLIHLLFAACATQKKKPWEEEILINDRVVSEFLGLNQRRDINRFKKLLLIQSLIEQACELEVEIHWQQRGNIKAIHLPQQRLWNVDTTYHISTNETGSHYLSGLSFKVLTGSWAIYFLNKEKARTKAAYYQYSWLPISLPPKIMNLWQRHEGAVVLLLYLLFRLRVGTDRCAKVITLLKLIYGEEYLQTAWYKSEVRRKVISTFESDLEQLFYYGLKPVFEPITYPEDIQPAWINDQNIPDDPEEACLYWTQEGAQSKNNINSKNKWIQLLNATIKTFEFPDDWCLEMTKIRHKNSNRSPTVKNINITGDIIKRAREQKGISQRKLSSLLGKSQSWIRDIESGRYKIKQKDVVVLTSVLGDLLP